MNITFLIGNGFDLNLGLDTRYTDFLAEYLQDNSQDNEEIKSFKADIRKQQCGNSDTSENLWANAELAFGRYTDDVVKQEKRRIRFPEGILIFAGNWQCICRNRRKRFALKDMSKLLLRQSISFVLV